MSILLPGLAQGRKRAVAIECMSNLRSLGMLHTDADGFRMNGDWGNSAYDFMHEPEGDDGENRNIGNNGEPTRVKDARGDRIRSDSGELFDLGLEVMAANAPASLTLVCPPGDAEGLNSYGMTYKTQSRPFSLFFRSNQAVFGCSDYKVVIDPRSFAFRHLEASNLYFADGHVKLFAMRDFSNQMVKDLTRK